MAAQAQRQINSVTTAGLRLLLLNLFLELLLAFAIGNFRGFPRLAQQHSSLFGVYGPQRIGDTRERARSKSLIVKRAGIGGERDQE